MKLLDIDKRVLTAVQLNANLSVPQIAKQLRTKTHIVNHSLTKLLKLEVISYHCFIDMCVLGYTQYTIFFSFLPSENWTRTKMLSHLVDSESVSWLGLLGGDFQIGGTICARNATEAKIFINNLTDLFPGIFFQRSIAVLTRLTHFPMKYLSSEKTLPPFLQIGFQNTLVDLDEENHRILESLSKGDARSTRDIAKKVGLSHSAVANRIRLLEKEGVITGHSYMGNSAKLGVQMYLLLIFLRSLDLNTQDTIFRFCKRHKNINFVIEYLGEFDFEIGVEIDDPMKLTGIVDELSEQLGTNLSRVKVLQVFDYPKVSKYPFRKNPS